MLLLRGVVKIGKVLYMDQFIKLERNIHRNELEKNNSFLIKVFSTQSYLSLRQNRTEKF